VTASWTDPGYAGAWARHDSQRELLTLPRLIATQVIADDRPDVALVVDIGSGPGDFLAVALDRFPAARGLWTDISPEMQTIAAQHLARFGDRVEYRLTDMTDIGRHLPGNADAIISSRVIHHLDAAGVADLYRTAAEHLAPGGWLVNLDHTALVPEWDGRARRARKQLIPRTGPTQSHRAEHGTLPTIADHLSALSSAGLTDVDVPWRAFVTCLFMARKGGPDASGG
jgi:SAM-dependent methyltransferase